jgi:hypothetical protein
MKKLIIHGFAIILLALTFVFSCKKKEPEPETNNYGSGNGMVTFYLKSDLGLGNITVSVDGQVKGTITQFHSDGVTCGSGNVNVTLTKGNHTLYAVSQTGSVIWNNTFTIYEADCLHFELTYNGTGGTITGGTTTGGTTTGSSTTSGTTTGGTTTGSSTTGGTTTGCTSYNNYVSIVSLTYNTCGTGNDLKVTIQNNYMFRLAVQISIQRSNGTWDCGVTTPSPGNTPNYWTCNSTGQYQIKSMLYSDYMSGCSFGACP